MLPQRYLLKVVKVVFVLSTCAFFLLQILARSRTPAAGDSPVLAPGQKSANGREADGKILTSFGDEDLPMANGARVNSSAGKQKEAAPGWPTSMLYSSANMPSLVDIRQSIEYNNAHTEIRHLEKYGPIDNDTVAIVVQVHNRPKYLEKLVQSLREARHIHKALLIFSHDYYSPEINKIIDDIDFCRVTQIFYPYSIQIFPTVFPGHDPADCPPDATKESAAELRCNNWAHPDKYGHYRNYKYTQIKHHWWWKMNYVWRGIKEMRRFHGWLLLLEEDHFVSPDFLHVLQLIIENKQRITVQSFTRSLCAECMVISLGVYLKSYASYAQHSDKLAVHPWFSSKHNMGLALNRHTWQQVHNCSQLFCTYDDYNWDWSLMKVNLQCFKPRLQVLFTKAPRVFHIGDCGVHHACKADTSAAKVRAVLDAASGSLYPAQVHAVERSRRTLKPPKENGGWGDLRDHELCMNNTMNSAADSGNL